MCAGATSVCGQTKAALTPCPNTGPGQMDAFQARRHITTLGRARPDIIIEIRWCQSHQGDWGNEKVDEWAKLAAEDQMHMAWNDFMDEPYLCCYPGPWHSWSGRARRRSEGRCFFCIYHPRIKRIWTMAAHLFDRFLLAVRANGGTLNAFRCPPLRPVPRDRNRTKEITKERER
jgi:hypothetical protein